MQGRLRFTLQQALRSLWFRPALFALMVLAVLGAMPLLQPLVPDGWAQAVNEDVTLTVLTTLNTGMLAVAIFSVTVMVNQLNQTELVALPRTRPLLAGDRTAHNAISTFVGAFLFGIFGSVAIKLGVYDETGIFLIFSLGIILILLVTFHLILWVRRLSRLGGAAEAIALVANEADTAFEKVSKRPHGGGAPAADGPQDGHELIAADTGFVRTIDVAALQRTAERVGGRIRMEVRPGAFVDRTVTIAVSDVEPDDRMRNAVSDAIVIGKERDFSLDPLYGIEVLSQIASLALSPGVNNLGTAIDVIVVQTRVLDRWRRHVDEREPADPEYRRVFMPGIDPAQAIETAFAAISRDGAAMAEIDRLLIGALEALARIDPDAFGPAARRLIETHEARAGQLRLERQVS